MAGTITNCEHKLTRRPIAQHLVSVRTLENEPESTGLNVGLLQTLRDVKVMKPLDALLR